MKIHKKTQCQAGHQAIPGLYWHSHEPAIMKRICIKCKQDLYYAGIVMLANGDIDKMVSAEIKIVEDWLDERAYR